MAISQEISENHKSWQWGFAGFVTSGARKIGEKIPRGKDGNYKTIFEVGTGLVGGVIQSDMDNKQ